MSRLRVFAQLIRVPNVFTALADIFLGVLVTRQMPSEGGPGSFWFPACLLMATSACLYCGGMVWNDVFDFEQDQRERPFRPLPSGRVKRKEAIRLGSALFGTGLIFAVLAGFRGDGFHLISLGLGCLLVLVIFLYDGWLKHTWAGPLGMGACRFFNVLLGFSLAVHLQGHQGVYAALVVGLYVVGVTWFARTEARTSKRSALTGAAGVMLVALILALPVPVVKPDNISSHPSWIFPYLLVGLGFLVGFPVCWAIDRPSPTSVQKAVKQAIFGLVVLDSVLATGMVGWVGLTILLLLLPALVMGRWIYST